MTDEEKTKILWWVIGALVGSVTLNQGINKSFTEVRSNPFTGTEGRAMGLKIDSIERRMDGIYSEQQKMIYRMERREAVSEKCMGLIQGHLNQRGIHQ